MLPLCAPPCSSPLSPGGGVGVGPSAIISIWERSAISSSACMRICCERKPLSSSCVPVPSAEEDNEGSSSWMLMSLSRGASISIPLDIPMPSFSSGVPQMSPSSPPSVCVYESRVSTVVSGRRATGRFASVPTRDWPE